MERISDAADYQLVNVDYIDGDVHCVWRKIDLGQTPDFRRQ